MPDILDHPKFTAVMRGAGHNAAEIVMIKELARHATLEAFNAALRVINAAPDSLQSFVTLAATTVIRLECDRHLSDLEKALDERIKQNER